MRRSEFTTIRQGDLAFSPGRVGKIAGLSHLPKPGAGMTPIAERFRGRLLRSGRATSQSRQRIDRGALTID